MGCGRARQKRPRRRASFTIREAAEVCYFAPMQDQAAASQAGIHILAKPVGPLCNLSCRYCYYLEKESLYPSRTGLRGWTLSGDSLEEFIRQYIQASSSRVVSFAWQGGEPTLLGVDYFRKVVELQ